MIQAWLAVLIWWCHCSGYLLRIEFACSVRTPLMHNSVEVIFSSRFVVSALMQAGMRMIFTSSLVLNLKSTISDYDSSAGVVDLLLADLLDFDLLKVSCAVISKRMNIHSNFWLETQELEYCIWGSSLLLNNSNHLKPRISSRSMGANPAIASLHPRTGWKNNETISPPS